MATTSNMFLYSLTIQPPTCITQAVLGQFSGTREQQIVAASGSRLTLMRPDPSQGKVTTLLSHEVFGIIRSIATFRLAGSNKDYIILGTDSGRIAIVEYIPQQNRFKQQKLETFGKSGVRRVIPGQYLACDPKGRACLIAAVEKTKLVYVLNRNAQAELTISSPLEAHKPGTIVLAMTALDVGYANPVFAALEVDTSEVDQDPSGQAIEEVETQLVYYELDLGLNHVVRRWHEAVDPTASILFQVPGGNDGPSGVLVCGEENITYRHSNQDAFRVPIPRRKGATEDPQRKRTIVSGVMHKLKGNVGAFFFLLQTEDGDLFKVNIEMTEDENGKATGEVRRLKIKYFDTVPVSTSLCILKSGFLFVASEFGNHHFYQFEKLGDDDDELEFSSDDYPTDPQTPYTPAYFYPRPAENLSLVESIDSMNPLVDCKVANLTEEDAPQIYAICGNDLPGIPSAVWTTKLRRDDQYDAYIILSFSNGTLVLSIGETVEEVSDTGFLTSVPTLAVQQLGEDGLLQVHPKGIRHIINGQINEWPAPQHRSIVAASTNARQVAVALSSGEIVYFEMDADGSLAEIFSIDKLTDTVLQHTIPLTYTPKRLVKHPDQPYFYTIEADNNTLPPELREQLLADPGANKDAAVLPPEDFGYPKGRGRWASCISVVDPLTERRVLQTLSLEDNEAAVSMATVSFASQDNEAFLVVGTGKDMILSPRQFSAGFIYVYRFRENGKEIEFIHKTKVDEPPMALAQFQGRLLAGIGKTLLSYDLGLRQLLRKSQADVASQLIVSIQTQGSRIIVGDVQQSVTFVAYKYESNKLIPFADDTIPRWTNCTTMVDYESIAGGDKFGNIWIVRCPQKASEEADEDNIGAHLQHAREYLHGSNHRLSLMTHFYAQDVPTSISKTNLVVGGQDVLLWSGVQGTVGVFIPFVSREDVDFFQSLELHMRSEDPPLAGRDHLIYRSYYAPVKGVIDGDLCERFALLSHDKKQMIAGELDRSVREIERKISDVRTRSAF
ncbi:hypothetical protein ONZ43_g1589 [Nemania bipapillata]|uniref:Uncharacterized protein n=1 Tax=Nemania bipapillata TaxID=110536 RepID=A0ACC2J415_9PEZI|nr:hypothetical protein ONZ43_g1589 [Nemania bipapillata]